MVYNNQKGQVALFITLITLFIMLTVGLSLSEMTIKQTKITRDAYRSVQAYCLADSGTEHVLYEIVKNKMLVCPPAAPISLLSDPYPNFAGGSYQADLSGCNPTIIKIFGVFERTNRTIQISY